MAEARRVNETQDDVLRYVGGSISPEMEIPKLLWAEAAPAVDLSNQPVISSTSPTIFRFARPARRRVRCAHWPANGIISPTNSAGAGPILRRVGLGDLASDKYAKIGKRDRCTRHAAGRGVENLCGTRFRPAGRDAGRRVADRRSRRSVGTIGGSGSQVSRSMCAVALPTSWETSACIMATTPSLASSRASGDPNLSGMVPGFWLNEGGQSAAGAAIDHLVKSHPAHGEAVAAAHAARHGDSGIS